MVSPERLINPELPINPKLEEKLTSEFGESEVAKT